MGSSCVGGISAESEAVECGNVERTGEMAVTPSSRNCRGPLRNRSISQSPRRGNGERTIPLPARRGSGPLGDRDIHVDRLRGEHERGKDIDGLAGGRGRWNLDTAFNRNDVDYADAHRGPGKDVRTRAMLVSGPAATRRSPVVAATLRTMKSTAGSSTGPLAGSGGSWPPASCTKAPSSGAATLATTGTQASPASSGILHMLAAATVALPKTVVIPRRSRQHPATRGPWHRHDPCRGRGTPGPSLSRGRAEPPPARCSSPACGRRRDR